MPTLLDRGIIVPLILFGFVAVPAQAQTYVEFTVTGSASLSHREEETALCSVTEDGLQGQGGSEWVISFEAAGSGVGTHEARFTVGAPQAVTALHDDDFRTDDRLRGTGTVVVADAGPGEMGIPLVRVRFTAAKLESDTGAAIGLEGTLVCPVL